MDYIVMSNSCGSSDPRICSDDKGHSREWSGISQYKPVATAALGRLLTAGSMMGAMMKGEKDLLTLQIQCSGPIGGLTVTAIRRLM